jgi:hypothetical protein
MSAKLKPSLKYQGSLIRPRFAPGLLLLDEDLTATVDHTRNLSRLLFRSLFGCGVICGFKVTATVECGDLSVTVAPGVALDCYGDPIEMCKPQVLGKHCVEKLEKPLWVVIRRSGEHACAPRDVVCPSEDGSNPLEPTRTRDCFELMLVDTVAKGACMCARPAAAGANGNGAGSAGDKGEAGGSGPSAAAGAAAGVKEEPSGNTEPRSAAQPSDLELDWPCHRDHYCGECGCGCGCGGHCGGCCGEGWVVLALVDNKQPVASDQPQTRKVEHGVRRFIRPRLAADPLASQNQQLLGKCNDGKQPAEKPS